MMIINNNYYYKHLLLSNIKNYQKLLQIIKNYQKLKMQIIMIFQVDIIYNIKRII
jgi:hypothetical protein